MDERKEEASTLLDPSQIRFLIPECCREGWDSCKHVVNRPKEKTKHNIGL